MKYKISSRRKRGFFLLLLIGLWCLIFGPLLISFPGSAYAAKVTLAWDKSDGATGYKVYSGLSSNSYSWVIDVGNTTTYTTEDLTDGYTYYFVTTAYDASLLESDYSS